MKIFITGASGFIGKHLVSKLIEKGHQVTVNLQKNEVSPFSYNVKTHALNQENIQVDAQYLKNEKFDGVIHLASLYLKVHKPSDAINLVNSNVLFSTYILECASQAQVKWFLNTGTFWQHYQNQNYSPVNLYAATKQAFESIAQFYIETNQIKFCTLKLSDTYGPNDTRSKIFNLWDIAAQTGEIIKMSGGEQIIDISYIDDIVSAYCILAKHLDENDVEIVNGSVYAIYAERRYSLKELASIYENVTGVKLHIKWGEIPYKEREVMLPWDKGNNIPNFKSQVTIEEGIKTICNSSRDKH